MGSAKTTGKTWRSDGRDTLRAEAGPEQLGLVPAFPEWTYVSAHLHEDPDLLWSTSDNALPGSDDRCRKRCGRRPERPLHFFERYSPSRYLHLEQKARCVALL